MNQSKYKIVSKGNTHIGMVRSTNQDSYLVDPEHHIYMVADGMGGYAGGEVASSLCVSEFKRHILNLKSHKIEQHPDLKMAFEMTEAVNNASTKIYEKALEAPNLRGMGTTATAVKIIDDYLYCAHVGDSRLYLIRSNYIYQFTYDHSLVSEQLRAGIITEEEAENHRLSHIITRSVGCQEVEEVDRQWLQLEPGDLWLICSDGLHGKVKNKEIFSMVSTQKCQAVDPLIALANERGGEDNISVVILEIQDL